MLIISLILPVVQVLYGACVESQRLPKGLRTQPHPMLWRRPPARPTLETRTLPRTGNILWSPPNSYQEMSHSLPGIPSFKSPRLPSAKGTGARYQSHMHPQKPSKFLSSIFDPFGFFSSQGVRLERTDAHTAFMRRVGGQEPTTTESPPPPMVYFPEGSSDACEDFNPSGFNTYSFLSFLFSVANLVGLIANNVNNNLRNNNNNNNDNNNNLDNINVANSNSNQNNENNVNIPAVMGRRRRRGVEGAVEVDLTEYEDSLDLREREKTTVWVVKDFIEAMKVALLTLDEGCALRNFCETNSKAITRGPLADIISKVFSQALVDMYPTKLPTSKAALLLAGSKGRYSKSCNSYQAECRNARWRQLTSGLNFDDQVVDIPLDELFREFGFEGAGGLLSAISFVAYGSAMPF
ncbi:uncharacterized protein [Macrobrachium rosenbergii]|uniref:uncharacterized protein n=1 Tax=Macrobrachium rosenbergii TaxID=79674 RepID=UPI0034D72954